MVYLDRIYTKSGDTGETSLGDGSRVPKTHPRIMAYGGVDELNAGPFENFGRRQHIFGMGQPTHSNNGRMFDDHHSVGRRSFDKSFSERPLPKVSLSVSHPSHSIYNNLVHSSNSIPSVGVKRNAGTFVICAPAFLMLIVLEEAI